LGHRFANEHTGSLPSEIGRLSAVQYLDISSNSLTGTLPVTLSGMTSLKTLWLGDNMLSGTIPTQLGLMSNLENIYLVSSTSYIKVTEEPRHTSLLTMCFFQSGNNFFGSVPAEVCALASLQNIEVDCSKVRCDCCSECSPVVDALFELLVSLSPDGGQALSDASSPQYAAFEWLRSPMNTGITSQQTLIQRYALASLYFSTTGDAWTTSSLWLTNTSECLWFTAESEGDVCDSDGNYININLRGNNVGGTLPLEVLLLAETLGE
jgi:hypothetical protein